jgi:uncharacterized protein
MANVRQLYQLQLLDSERDGKHQRLAEVNDRLGESRERIQAREAVAETEASLAETRAQLRALELEIAGVNDKLKKNQDRLYSGRIRNPKELTSLQDEARALRRRRSELEDQQLELMIGIEEEEAELAEREARLRQIEASWQQEQASLRVEKEQLNGELAALDEEREAIRARIGSSTLATYDDLRERQGGTAVALLKRGICQACGVDVPTSMARAIERGEGTNFCPICNRILYGG